MYTYPSISFSHSILHASKEVFQSCKSSFLDRQMQGCGFAMNLLALTGTRPMDLKGLVFCIR